MIEICVDLYCLTTSFWFFKSLGLASEWPRAVAAAAGLQGRLRGFEDLRPATAVAAGDEIGQLGDGT